MKSSALKDITFLVSCYNKLEYLDRFFQNVMLGQSLGASFLIIDDGSSDGSTTRLKDFAKHIPNLRLISRANQGSGDTRNELLSQAKTRYIYFWDIDDLVDISAIADALQFMKNTESDLCVAGFKYFTSSEIHCLKTSKDSILQVQIEDVRHDMWNSLGFWRYIYDRKWVENNSLIFFPTSFELNNRYFIFDDVFWMLQVASSCGKLLIMPKEFVFYRYDAPIFNSLAQRRYKKQLSLVPEFSFRFFELRSMNISPKIRFRDEFLFEYIGFALSNMALGKSIRAILYTVKLKKYFPQTSVALENNASYFHFVYRNLLLNWISILRRAFSSN